MTHARTVLWLAVLVAIIPFLAIPEWIMRTLLVLSALGLIFVSWRDELDTTTERATGRWRPSQNDNDTTDNRGQSADDQPTRSQKSTRDEPTKTDIEDPQADQMVASNQWRRRSSRDIDE